LIPTAIFTLSLFLTLTAVMYWWAKVGCKRIPANQFYASCVGVFWFKQVYWNEASTAGLGLWGFRAMLQHEYAHSKLYHPEKLVILASLLYGGIFYIGTISWLWIPAIPSTMIFLTWLQRQFEYQADSACLKDPELAKGMLIHLKKTIQINYWPNFLYQIFFGTHPTSYDRINHLLRQVKKKAIRVDNQPEK